MRLELEVRIEENEWGPWAEIALVEVGGERRWPVASPVVNPEHAHLSPEELGVKILADALGKVIPS